MSVFQLNPANLSDSDNILGQSSNNTSNSMNAPQMNLPPNALHSTIVGGKKQKCSRRMKNKCSRKKNKRTKACRKMRKSCKRK